MLNQSIISGNSHSSVLVPLTNTILLLGAPVLPLWWVKISTYLHLEPSLLIAFMLLIVDRIFYCHYYYYAIIPITLICIIIIFIIILSLLI
jgi:hypothetical protein